MYVANIENWEQVQYLCEVYNLYEVIIWSRILTVNNPMDFVYICIHGVYVIKKHEAWINTGY